MDYEGSVLRVENSSWRILIS